MPVAVVTDTTTYLPREIVDREGIHEVEPVPHAGRHGDARGRLNSDLDAFYGELRAASETPKTSQPSIGDFLDVYGPLLAAGHDIVSIHLAAGISGTKETARLAALEALAGAPPGGERRIEVVDSESACGGLGLIVLAAATAANAGTASKTCSRARSRLAAPGTSGSRSTRSSTCGGAGASAACSRGWAAR